MYLRAVKDFELMSHCKEIFSFNYYTCIPAMVIENKSLKSNPSLLRAALSP